MDLLQIFDEHHATLFRFAYRLTGSVADAEDIVQTCFLQLLRPDCSYDPKRAPLRKLVAVSNGIPATAKSTPSVPVTWGSRMKVRTPAKRGFTNASAGP